MGDIWYYADQSGHIGPLTMLELKGALATVANAKDVLVWHEGFSDWKKAGEIPELRDITVRPPPLPKTASTKQTTWKAKWWQLIIAFAFMGSIGSRFGREEMCRLSDERRTARRAR
jgi:hypothetical protein